jgi:hypothetical protein
LLEFVEVQETAVVLVVLLEDLFDFCVTVLRHGEESMEVGVRGCAAMEKEEEEEEDLFNRKKIRKRESHSLNSSNLMLSPINSRSSFVNPNHTLSQIT